MDPDADRPPGDSGGSAPAGSGGSAPADGGHSRQGDGGHSEPGTGVAGRPGVSQAAPPAGRVGRIAERSPKDMAISLLILLLPIALLLAFNRFVLDGEKPTVVDPGPVVEQARAAGTFPVDQPVGLDPGWRPVRADFRRAENGATLRIGYLAPQEEGVQLVQSSTPADLLLPAELTAAARPEGAVDIAGRQWQRYPATRPGERALVLLEPERSIVVVGSAEEERLRELAGALRPA